MEMQKNITITDSFGNTVTLLHPAERIICQSNGAVELLVILGAGSKVVGVTDYQITNDTLLKTSLPNAESIGNFKTPNIEKIVALKPDLILLYSISKPNNLDQIKNTGIPILYVDGYIPSTINHDAQLLGKVTGTEENASRYSKFNSHYYDLVQSRLSGGNITRPRAYIEAYTSYMARGNGSSGNEMIQSLHADNIADNLSGSAIVVSPEWIIEKDPEIIIKSSMEQNLTKTYEDIAGRPGFENISAVRNKRIVVYNGPATSRPRYIVTYLYLAKEIHPELFSDTDPVIVLHEYAQHFLPGSDSDIPFYPFPGSPGRNPV
jgi:iron complex transport system substrate-binding protein